MGNDLTWQRLGHTSCKEWRRVAAKKRREAKATAKKAGSAAAPPTLQWQPQQNMSPMPQRLVLSPGLAQPSPPKTKTGGLPGQLFEVVQVTPQGRRKHNFKYISPGGKLQADEYISPAGVQERGEPMCGQRLACLRRIQSSRRAACPDRRLKFEREKSCYEQYDRDRKEHLKSRQLPLSKAAS